MNEPTEIKTVNNSYKTELKIKSSRFIGLVFPAEDEKAAFSNLERIKKEYFDATHHCYAYKLLDSVKYTDDGEPAGTAGIRILNALEHFNLVNTMVIVVRYFGGTKLGIGGLGRAYFETALKSLNEVEIKTRSLFKKVVIKVDFQLMQVIYHLCNNSENRILHVNYSNTSDFACLIKPETLNQFISRIKDSTNGKVEILQGENVYY